MPDYQLKHKLPIRFIRYLSACRPMEALPVPISCCVAQFCDPERLDYPAHSVLGYTLLCRSGAGAKTIPMSPALAWWLRSNPRASRIALGPARMMFQRIPQVLAAAACESAGHWPGFCSGIWPTL